MSAMFIIQQSIYPCDDALKDEPENNILKLNTTTVLLSY